MDTKNLPVIDWELGTRLAGKKEIAEEILSYLVATLPEDNDDIQRFYVKHQYPELKQRVHKLHGAVCYCPTPRLKQALAQLESELKTNIMDGLAKRLSELNKEVTLVLEAYPPPR